MVKFTKIANTKSIVGTTVITGQGAYNPQPTSARGTHLSWQALGIALKAGKGSCTVAAYLTQQKITNPQNVGDGLPCLRYWAGNGKIAVKA